MSNKKIDFSKIKELGNMDIKDLKNIFKKDSSLSNDKKENKLVKKIKAGMEKPKNIVAFDIGSSSIKIVTGKYFKNKLTINKLIDTPTPEGAISDGKILSKQILGDMIQFALNENGIKINDAICTTNSSLIINREIIIPKVEEEEMETVIRYEIKQYLPINLNDYILQFIVLDEIIDNTGDKLKVSVISYPENMAYAYYDLLNLLELNPYSLDIEYNSLRKIAEYSKFNNNGEVSGGAVAFVDMGATSINVTILKNGKLDFTRMIKTGGDNISYALSKNLNMSIKSTESIKIEKGNLLDIKEDDIVNVTIRDVIDDVLEELQRILQFYINKSSGVQLNKIFIYGGVANTKGIDSYMENRVKISVEKITTLENVDFSSKEISEEHIGEFVNAIGSIIRL